MINSFKFSYDDFFFDLSYNKYSEGRLIYMHTDTQVTSLRGIGPKKAAAYEKLGIKTVRQLLLHQPRGFIDLRFADELDEIPINDGILHLIKARIISKGREQFIRKGFSVFKVMAESAGLDLKLTFYNTRYTVQSLAIDSEVYFYGPVEGSFLHREMKAPVIIDPALIGTLSPVYPATAGLSSKIIASDIRRVLKEKNVNIPSVLSDDDVKSLGLLSLNEAIRKIHSPENYEEAQNARKRLSLEALVTYSSAMLSIRGARETISCEPVNTAGIEKFFSNLPYEPTNAQKRSINDILSDLSSGKVMCRLVQGDVGSGKTLVAAAAAYAVCKNGYQAALMAPTEILAEQHLRTMKGFLEPLGIRLALLTGAMTTKERRVILSGLSSGDVDLIIGTHALFQEGVEFNSLGLVITDEQHRFGVAQRSALSAKGSGVHTLVMSATPIPRTLSLILYGDLDLSLIDEMPAGRQPVSTYVIDSAKRLRAMNFIKQHLDNGRQAYIVCPLVEESENIEGLISASEYAEQLKNGVFCDYRVGLLHGKMKPKEKDAVMRAFAAGEIQLLVSTTVIEVGVDVPNSVIMLIENAERFGLSQLHQLRGRVGRGPHESYCILVSDSKNETTRERLSVIRRISDGFKIAEEDLRLRGPGDLLGLRQHGMPNVDLVSDPELFIKAQEAAIRILKDDPRLSSPSHSTLKNEVDMLIGSVGCSVN